eukprot:gene1105-10619_t
MLRILQNVKVIKTSTGTKRFFRPSIKILNDFEEKKKVVRELEEEEEEEDEDEDDDEEDDEEGVGYYGEDAEINEKEMKENFKKTLFGIPKKDFDDGTLLRELLRTGGTLKDEIATAVDEEQNFDENESIKKIERVLRNHFKDEKPIQFANNEMLKKIKKKENEFENDKLKKQTFFFNKNEAQFEVEEPYENVIDQSEFSVDEIKEGYESLKNQQENEFEQSHIDGLNPNKLRDAGEFGEKHFIEKFLHPIESINKTLDTKDDFNNFWDEESTKKLWKFLGGKNFRSKEEFLHQIRFTTNEEGAISKFEKEFPNLGKDQIKYIFDRLIKTLQKNESRFVNSNELAIQKITENITETAKPIYLKWVDRHSTIDEKFYGIEKAMLKIYKSKLKKKEIRETVANLKKYNRKDYDNDDDFLYDFLSPLHKTDSSMTKEPPKLKEYEPKIFGGISEGYGRRKTSHARVWVTPGTGLFKVNDKPYNQYFDDRFQLSMLAEPFNLLGTFNQFDVKATVRGGGFSSQCEAVRGGICRAIAAFIPKMGNVYARHKLMTFDRRNVERKKPGRKKARKRFQWVKR